MKDKLLDEIRTNLNGIVGEEKSDEILSTMMVWKRSCILSNMFFSESSEEDYVKGRVLTVVELKSLPEGSVIHLWYIDEDRHLRSDDFLTLLDVNCDDMCTDCGFPIPLGGHSDDELVERFDNCGWTFTVREAIEK